MSETPSNGEREDAIHTILALMQRFDITADELRRHHRPQDEDAAPAQLLVRVLSYIGGIFVFAGIAIFIGLQWAGLNSAARVIITLGPGVAAFALGALAFSETRFQRAAMPLMLMAAALLPTGMMVAFAEYGGGGDERIAACITTATCGAQYVFGFVRWRQTMLGWVAVFFVSAAFGFAFDLAGVSENGIAVALGTGWLALGTAFLQTSHVLLSAQLYIIGCWAFLWGLFDLLRGSWLEVLFVAAVCALVFLGVWAKSRALNLATTIALFAYTAYFTDRYFADSIGWPIALILIGLLMMAIGAVALKIDRDYLRKTAAVDQRSR